jgi:hypothetical protein
MDEDLNVALVRGDRRRGAAAEALALLAAVLRDRVTPSVIITSAPRTHADVLSALLDAVFHAGAVEAVVVDSPGPAERRAHRREAFGRPVRFVGPAEPGMAPLLNAIAAASCCIRLDRLARGFPFGSIGRAPARRRTPAWSFDEAGMQPAFQLIDAFDVGRAAIAGADAAAVRTALAVALGWRPARDAGHIRSLGDPIARTATTRAEHAPDRPRRSRAARHDRAASH